MFQDSEFILTISRVLSYSVVALCSVVKLPQIYAIASAKSSAGISLRAYWLEISTYLISLFYGYTNNFHFSVYAESGLLALQDTLLIALVIYYDRKWTSLENISLTLLMAGFVWASLTDLIPQYIHRFLLSTTLVTSTISKLGQILSIYALKSQGEVSMVTWGLSGYGCVVRVLSSLVEVGDYLVVLNFVVASHLNIFVVAQCLYYGKGKKKKE